MGRATEIAFSVTDRSYETDNFLSLLNKVAYCAAEYAEKIANLDDTLAERNHYHPVLWSRCSPDHVLQRAKQKPCKGGRLRPD